MKLLEEFSGSAFIFILQALVPTYDMHLIHIPIYHIILKSWKIMRVGKWKLRFKCIHRYAKEDDACL